MSPYAILPLAIILVCVSLILYFQIAPGIYSRRWKNKVDSASGLVWFRIIGESRRMNEIDGNRDSQLDGVKSFINSVRNSDSFVSIVWHKDNSSAVKMYIGVPLSSISISQGTLTNLARSLCGRLERSEQPPIIENPDYAQLARDDYDANSISTFLTQTGSMASAMDLSTVSKNCSIVMTFERASKSECARLGAEISETTIMRSGDASRFGGDTGIKANHMTSNLVRSSIVAITQKNNNYRASDFLVNAISSITNLGYNAYAFNPVNVYNREIFIAMAISLFMTGVTMLMGGIPLISGMFILVLIGVLSNINLIASSQIQSDSFKDNLDNGYMPIVPYSRLSLRWLFVSMFRFTFRNDAGGQSMGNRVAPPSHRAVCHMYSTSLAQFISLPMDGSVSDIDEDRLPKIGVAQKFVARKCKTDTFFGFTGKGQPMMSSIYNAATGLFVSGSQGSGKTHYLEFLFMNYAKITEMSKRDKSSFQTGDSFFKEPEIVKMSPLWFEIKGEGAISVYDSVKKINNRSIFIDTNNPASPYRLTLEGPRLTDINPATGKNYNMRTVMNNITQLVDGMQYAFGDGIKAESKQALYTAILTAAIMNEEEYERLGLRNKLENIKKPNIIHAAWLLLGGDTEIQLEKLLSSIRHDIDDMHERIANHEPREGDYKTARTTQLSNNLAILISYAGKNNAKAQPALNKLSDLMKLKGFWEPREGVTEVSIASMVHHFAPIVVNFGPYLKKDGNYSTIDKGISNKISLITSHMTWGYVKAACSGWQDKRQFIPVFYDEVKSVAVDSNSDDHPNIIMEGHDDGRSKGWFYNAATQNFEHIPRSAQRTVYSFFNKVTFKLGGVDDHRQVIKMMGGSEAKYQERHIANIEHPFGVAISFRSDDGNTDPFTLEVPYKAKWLQYLLNNDTVYDAVQEYLEKEQLTSNTQVNNEYI